MRLNRPWTRESFQYGWIKVRNENEKFINIYKNSVFYIASDYICLLMCRERFPPNEYASELRQAQASKWAFRSVAEGIDHFKAGRHAEAFQCLNKALTVDPRNVEGLVARGAL